MICHDNRYITIEEMEQAIREYGMNDGRDIKEIVSEIDTDNVSNQRQNNIQIQKLFILTPGK